MDLTLCSCENAVKPLSWATPCVERKGLEKWLSPGVGGKTEKTAKGGESFDSFKEQGCDRREPGSLESGPWCREEGTV